jgi:hypothetical protein
MLARKLKYYGHIKRHNCLERNIMEGTVPDRRGRGRSRRRWFQDIRETLNMTSEEVGILARQGFLQTGCDESYVLVRTCNTTQII